MKLKFPESLVTGQKVAIVAPASPPESPRLIDRAVDAVEALGFEVELGKNVRRRLGYLAGTDKERASDLMRAFLNPKIDGIFCLRGGYGASRILPLLDYGAIRRNPKALIGYSDITALHCALYQCAGLASFHGPTASSFIGKENKITAKNSLLSILSCGVSELEILTSKGKSHVVRPGIAKGRLLGGNLSILASLVGTKFFPDLRGALLFLEEVGEPPYRIDRYLTQLISSGALKSIKGIVLGQFTKCEDKHLRMGRDRRPTVEEVLIERLSSIRIPILRDVRIGHIEDNVTIPIGYTGYLAVSSRFSALTCLL